MTAMISPSDAAYAAGLFDGEGCIASQEYIALTLSNCDFRLIKKMFVLFGGRVGIGHPGDNRRNVCFTWGLRAKGEVLSALQAMIPYLVGKRDEALLAIRVLEQCPRLVGQRGLRQHPTAQLRENLLGQVKALKKQKLALALNEAGFATANELVRSLYTPKTKSKVMPETRAARSAVRGERWHEVYGNRRKRRWYKKPVDLNTIEALNKEPV